MSVPVLMTVLDSASLDAAQAALTSTLAPLLLNEHIKDCNSYVEAAAVIAPKFVGVTRGTDSPVVNGLVSGSPESDTIDVGAATLEKSSCIPKARPFSVMLRTDLAEHEMIGLTGDSDALGNWQLDNSVTLHPQGEHQWGTTVLLRDCDANNYRYFVYTLDSAGRKLIRRWETPLRPRTLMSCNTNCRQLDHFGDVGTGEVQINRGWLNHESIVQLKFEREKMFQVHDVDKFDTENVAIKVVPKSTNSESLGRGLHIEVVKMKYGGSHLQAQSASGVPYKRGDIIIFHITLANPLRGEFVIQFYSSEQQLMGETVLSANDLVGSKGELQLPITEPGQATPIARLTLPYLVVKPFTDVKLDFYSTYAHYWPKSWPSLHVGHRGNGKSYIAEPPAERENTVASFMKAYEKFADMIELDVHLTADNIPIIYHDFGIRTAPQNKEITSSDQLEYVLIKDITYEMLKKARVFAVINGKPIEYPSHNSEPRIDHRIFPTLRDILESLPNTLGIDVEIKWPQGHACGGFEAEQTIDKNFFIDRVISDILTFGCGRPLIFSSFDADICTMLRFKQNIFPVMFLTMGETKKWSQFMDLRTRNFEQAVNNAQAFELAGTAPHAEDFLGETGAELLQKAREQGQIAIVWGDDCNSKERVEYFNAIGATGTCYDRSDLYMPPEKTQSFFNSTVLVTEFEGQCRPQEIRLEQQVAQ